MSVNAVLDTFKNGVLGGALGVSGLINTTTKSGFDNTSSGMIALIVIIVVLCVSLWIMSLIATYRLTGSSLQVILCFFFGCIYLFFAWIYYGITNHKLVKMTKM